MKNFRFDIENARLYLKLEEQPEKMTAMYMFSPWWTRPAFITSFEEIPAKTQVMFLKFKEDYGCLVPMVGEKSLVYLVPGTKEELCFEMLTYDEKIDRVDEPLFILERDTSLYKAVHKVFKKLCGDKKINMRDERNLPEMFRYLGWCSWDAFYTDITEEKVREKAKELKEKKVPVKWMLMDDGWLNTSPTPQSTHLPGPDYAPHGLLNDFKPDEKKFPLGFAQMIEEIKKENDVKWFGVWHAFPGYWDGVAPGSPLAEKEAENLITTANGLLLPSPVNGVNFYVDWYQYLKSQGIDFTKVDGQSNVRLHYEDTMPVPEAAKGSNYALESAAMWMNGAIINCMGMAMENILARPNTALSRNSDDFFPEKEEGFAEHLLQNAYNSIYHDEIYHCDWDMFWTKHPDSKKHSFLRAVSGSPLYFSDRIGETDPERIIPLIYLDGEVLMMDKSAKPTADCIFRNPQEEGILKLMNTATNGTGQKIGGIAAFNMTKSEQTDGFSPVDIDGLPEAEEYWVYDYFQKQVSILKKDEAYAVTLGVGEYGWYMMFPKEDKCLLAGLSKKFVGYLATEDVKEMGSAVRYILKEKGSINLIAESMPAKVLVEGMDVTDKVVKVADNLYELEMDAAPGKCVVEIFEG